MSVLSVAGQVQLWVVDEGQGALKLSTLQSSSACSVCLTPHGFEEMARQAVSTEFDSKRFDSKQAWRLAMRFATVLVTVVDPRRKHVVYSLRAPARATLWSRWSTGSPS